MECMLKGEGWIPVNGRSNCLCSSPFNVAEGVFCLPANRFHIVWGEGVQNGGLEMLDKGHDFMSVPAVRTPGLKQGAPLGAGSQEVSNRVLIPCRVRRMGRRSTSYLHYELRQSSLRGT